MHPAFVHEVLEQEFRHLAGISVDPRYDSGLALLNSDRYSELRNAASASTEVWRKAIGAAEDNPTENNKVACVQSLLQKEKAESDCLRVLTEAFHNVKQSALCLSGGGIRSATFSLGVLQELAALEILPTFDYLSTVSGGGYIGGWLSSLVYRAKLRNEHPFDFLLPQTSRKLEPEHQPIRHLRSYSNYLHPETGIMSADTWTLASIAIRNIVLNWFILVPLLLCPLLFASVVKLAVSTPLSNVAGALSILIGTALVSYTVYYISLQLPTGRTVPTLGQRPYLLSAWQPFVWAAAAVSIGWAWLDSSTRTHYSWQWAAVWGAGFHILGCTGAFLRSRVGQNREKAHPAPLLVTLRIAAIVLAVGALGGLSTRAILQYLAELNDSMLYAVFGVPVLIAVFGFYGILYIGLMSWASSDDDREWWARSGAWTLIACVGWIAWSSIALYGPVGLTALVTQFPALVTGIGGITGLITILLGKSPTTGRGSKDQAGSPLAKWALKLAAPVFSVLLLAFLALCGQGLANQIATFLNSRVATGRIQVQGLAYLATLVLCCVVCLVASRLINVNKFSLHAMYRDRLIRAYLGATRDESQREPDKFTGFDPSDNLSVFRLRGQRPFHVLNITLNLVRGARLAWQQRKAESFTVSPLHWGSLQLGYRDTYTSNIRRGIPISIANEYPDDPSINEENLSLGTSVAISGAAASPNMGYQSSSLLTFLMTMFNARLGWWLGNPGEAGNETWLHPGPNSAVRPLLDELFGLTDDQAPYVNLSDGGHFENLGLYEMVFRRCRHIVVVDNGCDPKYSFEDVGNAVRKIRIDYGIPIEFRAPAELLSYREQLARKTPSLHFSIADIRYSAVDGEGTDGTLLLIKPLVTGDESQDILNYSALDESFPQQPTLTDQSYDEAQFEAYRALGQHSIRTFSGYIDTLKLSGVEGLIGAAEAKLVSVKDRPQTSGASA